MNDKIKETLLKQLQLLQETDVEKLSLVATAKLSEALAGAITIVAYDRANYMPIMELKADASELARVIYPV